MEQSVLFAKWRNGNETEVNDCLMYLFLSSIICSLWQICLHKIGCIYVIHQLHHCGSTGIWMIISYARIQSVLYIPWSQKQSRTYLEIHSISYEPKYCLTNSHSQRIFFLFPQEKILGSVSSILAQMQSYFQNLCTSRNLMSKILDDVKNSTQ
jgi:hypothetical protein